MVWPLASWWRLRDSDRGAQLHWLTSGPTSDRVQYQFADESHPRRMSARGFLVKFARVTG